MDGFTKGLLCNVNLLALTDTSDDDFHTALDPLILSRGQPIKDMAPF